MEEDRTEGDMELSSISSWSEGVGEGGLEWWGGMRKSVEEEREAN